MSDAWGESLTKRIGDEIRRLRGGRSGQWLSDRTADLGQRVSRSTISEIETGRRKSITVSDLILLAAALDTTPVALVYPGPYRNPVEVWPGFEMPELWAAQWFSGLLRTISDVPYSDGAIARVPNPQAYSDTQARLRRARSVWELTEKKSAMMRDLELQRQRKRKGANVSDAAINNLVDSVADYQQRIERLEADDGR
jgi:transcriptional regulator with XRE-family HTH domain